MLTDLLNLLTDPAISWYFCSRSGMYRGSGQSSPTSGFPTSSTHVLSSFLQQRLPECFVARPVALIIVIVCIQISCHTATINIQLLLPKLIQNPCAYEHLFVCMCVFVFLCMHICVSVYVCICLWVCVCVCVCVCLCFCICVFVFVCICIWFCLFMWLCVRVHFFTNLSFCS